MLLAMWVGCAGSSPPVDPPTEPELPIANKGNDMVIQETTQGRLGGSSVGISNMWERPYALPDGSETSGLSATLTLAPGVTLVAGLGSVVQIGTGHFEVVAIEKAKGQLGAVHFQMVQGAGVRR